MATTVDAFGPVRVRWFTQPRMDLRDPNNRYAVAALQRHKREGLLLAVRARWVALAVVGILLPFLNPRAEVLYYEALLLLIGINGWVLSKVGQVGRSPLELFVIFIDMLLMTISLAVPNPFSVDTWPTSMYYEFGNFIYFFIILAVGTMSFGWRTIIALGNWTAILWAVTAALIWAFGHTMPELTEAARIAFGHDPGLFERLDPNNVNFDIRVQEIVVFLITAYALAVSVRRFDLLLLNNASLERARANLSRYFSPNVVEELSRNDEPLKAIREQDVAVMFVDIKGFTEYAADRDPAAVIETLRAFHGRMESEVFGCGGTLDKYLGDGLMATFGTPVAGDADASGALRCARHMLEAVEDWTQERIAAGLPPLEVSIGLHHGPVVLGDIGANRLEFAVIGNTVNVASRIEGLSRPLDARLVLSDAMYARVVVEVGSDDPLLADLQRVDDQAIRGVEGKVTVWRLP